MKYMIHAAPPRMWYVEGYLVPSMLAQGIPEKDIEVWNDVDGKGNLQSCLAGFKKCGRRKGGTWHLQDDVIICRDFAKRTQGADDGLVAGFCCRNFESMIHSGAVPANGMWYSFQCIYIPNRLAKGFVQWVEAGAGQITEYQVAIADGKHDDYLFRGYLRNEKAGERAFNMSPNLVDHIDFLIGGTILNPQRNIRVNRSFNFPDKDLVEQLAEKLNTR